MFIDNRMEPDRNTKPDKDCYVHGLGVSDYYICRSRDQYKDNCPHIKDYDLGVLFCSHLDRHKIREW